MPTNPLGPAVSRYTDDRDKQFAAVIFQAARPPLDSELNLLSLIDLEARAETVRALMPSGWLMNESNPRADFSTDPSYSNLFFFGRNATGEVRNLSWAVVNGWAIPVAGTQTGAPPLAPDDVDTWNKILLNNPTTSTGGNVAEFVFLEVWLARIDVDPAAPTIAPGKPQRGFIYRFGNVEGGFSYLPDDLVDPDANFETTKRVQIQYRIRVVQNVNLAQYPEGFDPSIVFAQGALSGASSVPFTNMRQALGDPGLWRAGTGDPTTFGTADGFSYAIPMCVVFRRNGAGFSDVGNLSGAFNRNGKAISRSGATIFTSGIVLPNNIIETDISFTLTSVSGTVLSTLNSFGEAYFQLDSEIIRVNNVVQTGPTAFTISMDRGQLQTSVRPHSAGVSLVPYTVRPDGLYADQIASTDILDLRHSVAQKFDYDSLLKTNLVELLKGQLRTSWKRFGSTNAAGPVVIYGDRITDSTIFTGGLTRLDGPNGNRRMFSDAVSTERYNVPLSVPTNATALGSTLQVQVAPYTIDVQWTSAPPVHTTGNRLQSGLFPTWWNGDVLTVLLSDFQVGLPATDASQVRFVLPAEDVDAVVIRFEGMTTDPNGAPVSLNPPDLTSPSATAPHFSVLPTGNAILKHGQGLIVGTDSLGNLTITFNSGTTDVALQEFLDAMQGNTSASYAQNVLLHLQFSVVYGAGRGLSHKPDFIHTCQYRGSPSNTSKVMLRSGLTDKGRMIPTYLGESPLVQTGKNRNLAKTSEIMIDPGSKSSYVAPYRNILIPSLLVRNGDRLNWYRVFSGVYTLFYQGAMPQLDQNGVTNVHPFVDSLNLFYTGGATRYSEIQSEYLPRPGLHYIPIIPTTNTVFPSGLNFFMMSKEGPNSNTSDWNLNFVSYPNAAGYYIVTPKVGENYGQNSGSLSVFGLKYSNPLIKAASGGAFKGIKFPPFYAPSRITGVYVRQGTSVIPVSSPFDTNRHFVNAPGSDVNLLKDQFDGPTCLLDVDVQGDLYFVLNADCIDIQKAINLGIVPIGSTFDTIDFLVECTLFGFDRGFLQTNNRILVARAAAGGSLPVVIDSFTATTDNKIGIIAPAPLSVNASNNEVTIYYNHSPYQGDVFGTQSSYSDDPYRLGPLNISDANSISNNPLGPVSTLSLLNKSGYEVLAATSFLTTLGTGRLSGSVPIPLLTSAQAPLNPPDFKGTLVDLNRRYSLNRVGFEDWATPRYPVLNSSLAARPSLKRSALFEVFDNDVHPEFAGCTSQLPLGAYFRDKDFVGKTLYGTRSTSGVGSNALGTLAFVPFQASMIQASPGLSTWEGVEYPVGNSSGTTGVGTESIVRVNGTQNLADQTTFKTTRGGAAYSATGPWTGGLITSRFPKARPNTEVGSILLGTAFLVRSMPESSSTGEIHMGHELQMIIVTQAVPSFLRDTDISHSAAGAGEGYTAVDRFRILGRPLEKRRGTVNLTALPADKPLFVNRIFDDPLNYGSSDQNLTSQKQESLTVSTNGQTVFTISARPLDPTAVQVFLNGAKLTYGVSYMVAGATNQTLTYVVGGTNPSLITTDALEAFYLVY